LKEKINIIDVGSVGGLGLPWKRHPENVGFTLSFDPFEKLIITDNSLKLQTAIWNCEGDLPFYIYSGLNHTGSSLLKQNYKWVEENFERIKHDGDPKLNNTWFERSQLVETRKLNVRTLDSVLSSLYAEYGIKIKFDFLKSDTQSGEYPILEGADNFLREAIALQLELYRYPLYENMVLKDDVIEYLTNKGFYVAGKLAYTGSFLSQADYLFIRKNIGGGAREKANLIKRFYQVNKSGNILIKPTIIERIIEKTESMYKKYFCR